MTSPFEERSRSGSPESPARVNGSAVNPVIVLELDHVNGLQAARAFGRRGIPVYGIAKDARHHCCRTRYVRRVIESSLNGRALVDTLLDLAGEIEGTPVLIPCSDKTVLAISAGRDELAEHYLFQLPPEDIVLDVMEKSRFYRRAIDADLAIPRSVIVDGPEGVDEACATLDFPCMMKPSAKTPEWSARTPAKGFKVDDPDDLRRLVEEYGNCGTDLIVQEWVEGADDAMFSCYAYLDEDLDVHAAVTAQKIRQWPIGTGSGSSSRVCDAPETIEQMRRTCEAFRCWGIIFVQFKRNEHTGKYELIEAHVGRPGLGMYICEAAGLDLLYKMYCDLTGREFDIKSVSPRESTVWVNVAEDTMAAIKLYNAGELTFKTWLRSLRGSRRYADLSVTDPAPFVLHASSLVRRHLGRALTSRGVNGTKPRASRQGAARSVR